MFGLKAIINGLCCAATALALQDAGIGMSTSTFWVVILLELVVLINSMYVDVDPG